MKANLIFSPRNYPDQHPLMPPLGLALITNHLRKQGFSVDQDDLDIKIFRDVKGKDRVANIDMDLLDNRRRVNRYIFDCKDDEGIELNTEKMLSKINHKGYDVFGFSIVDPIGYCTTASTLLMAKKLKEIHDIPIAVGGLFTKDNAEFFIKTGLVDYAITAYGEEGFSSILKQLEQGNIDPAKIPGNVYRKNDIFKHVKDSRNLCRFPDFSGLPMDKYIFNLSNATGNAFRGPDILVLPYYFMNGCPNACNFCGQSVKGRSFEAKSPEIITDELLKLTEKYKTRHFCFLNTTLNYKRSFVRDLCEEIDYSGLDIMWTDSANFRQLDRGLLKELKEVGLVRILYGLETGSQRMLNRINKNIDINKVSDNLKSGTELDIWNEIYLISGLPHENDDDIEQTKRFLAKNSSFVNYYHTNRFRLIESSYLDDPSRHGIKNVRYIADKDVNGSDFYSYAFDETDGLTWEQKLVQIDRSFKAITAKINDVKKNSMNFFGASNLQLIFSLFETNKNIRSIQKSYGEIISSIT